MPKASREPLITEMSAEFEGANLGDERLNRRLGLLADTLARRPDASFPHALDEAELEAAYRFFGNKRVAPEDVLEPHLQASARRAGEHARVLVVHDTTEFEFSGDAKREGLGRLLRPGQGFFGHFSMAASADGLRDPLGLLSVQTVFRYTPAVARKSRKKADNLGESERWRRGVENSESELPSTTKAIHVMDREGDSYATLGALHARGSSFVIRSNHDRTLADERKLRDVACSVEGVVEREVALSPRPKIEGPKGKRHPARGGRVAKLRFSATSVELRRTADAPKTSTARFVVNVVRIVEVDPPAGEQPVEWLLLTDLPIKTVADVEFIVDCYRARWIIEEFFKALKTGCQYENRQLESKHSLLNALAVLAPVAWRLLRLRHLARHAPKRPARDALTPSQLEVLRAVSKRPLPAKATVAEVLLAIAKLGGHLARNGEPGWIVLGRGFHDLLMMELAWRAARAM